MFSLYKGLFYDLYNFTRTLFPDGTIFYIVVVISAVCLFTISVMLFIHKKKTPRIKVIFDVMQYIVFASVALPSLFYFWGAFIYGHPLGWQLSGILIAFPLEIYPYVFACIVLSLVLYIIRTLLAPKPIE